MTEQAKEAIETAKQILLQAGAKEVYVFGSAARGTDTSRSDVDFAVKGLPARSFYDAVGQVAMSISVPFDVIDLDERSPFTDYLERKGNLVRVA